MARLNPVERWHRLPRDARDTVFQLAVVGWTLLPHLSHLASWCGPLVLLLLLWRAQLALRNEALPSRWLVAAVLGVAVALTLYSERTLFGRDAGVTMLVVLVSLKTLELRARRDALVVFFLGFFLVLTHFLYSQSMLVALSMLVSVWGLLTALVLAHMPVGRPPLARAGWLAARAALLGLPMMVLLFALFPRMAPLWGVPQDAAGRTGLSGTMELGGVASIANDDSVAMRVRFLGKVPAADQMYFRGPVLSRFDGRQWTRGGFSPLGGASAGLEQQVFGTPVEYELTIEPSRLALLPTLELTPDRDGARPVLEGIGTVLRSDAQWQIDRPLVERVRVRARAWTEPRQGPRLALLGQQEFTALPPGFNPRSVRWAKALREQPENIGADARLLAERLLSHLRREEFIYTLEPGGYGQHAVDEFWFDRRLGFCEHFAAGFVVMMRAMGIPSRVVTGYQGSDPQPIDGFHIVRQSHAHAWAEYWQAGDGWVRIDPTAAVSPERIRASRSLPPAQGFVAQALGSVSPQFAEQLRRGWEALNNRWNQWVLNYARGQQLDLLRGLGFGSPDWTDLAYVLIAVLSAASLAGAGWALWDRHRQDPWHRLQQRVALRLGALGVEVRGHDAPRTRALRVRKTLGQRGEALAALLDALDRARYAPRAEPQPLGRWWRDFDRVARQQGRS